jgi:NAD(P)-dependent dehydrogenase (short-subunit alcohol dehydrogenase family)
LVLHLDGRDEAAVEAVVTLVVGRYGCLDVLVNSAGIVHGGAILDMSRETWDAVLDTSLTSTFLCTKYAGRAMVAGGAAEGSSTSVRHARCLGHPISRSMRPRRPTCWASPELWRSRWRFTRSR